MEKTIYNEIEEILEKLESTLKTINNKEKELEMTIFVQEERIKEVREQYDNKNKELNNDNAHNIQVFEEMQNISNIVITEISKQQDNEVKIQELAKNKNAITKAYGELKNYLEEKQDKYNKLQEEKAKYQGIINSNTNMSPELELMYENKIGILDLNIDNIEISLNQKLEKCYRILPKEIMEKFEIKKEKEVSKNNKVGNEPKLQETQNEQNQVETNQTTIINMSQEENSTEKKEQEITETEFDQLKQRIVVPETNKNENSMSLQQLNQEVNEQLNSQKIGNDQNVNELIVNAADEADANTIKESKSLFPKVKSIKTTIARLFKRIQETTMNAFYSSGPNLEYKNGNPIVRTNTNTQVIDMKNNR